MTEREHMQQTMLEVHSLLDRIIFRLAQHIHKQADDQAAIRLLQSRKRHLLRLFQNQYGTPEESRQARIELTLAKPDYGHLLVIQGRKHGVSRFDCKACDTDDSTGVTKPLARLCPSCNHGVQHAYTVAYPAGVSVPSPLREKIQPCSSNAQQEGTGEGNLTLYGCYGCDNCGHIDFGAY